MTQHSGLPVLFAGAFAVDYKLGGFAVSAFTPTSGFLAAGSLK